MSFSFNDSNISNLTSASWACFSPLQPVSCIRHAVVSGFALLTLIPVLYKIIFFHYRRHSRWHQYVIFYLAAAQLIMLFLHWMLIAHIELAFVALFLKSAQSLTVVHFFCSLAAHQLRQEKVFTWVFVPSLVIIFLYFIATMIYALVTTGDDSVECYDSSWVQFAAGEVALTAVFLLAGIQITRKINSIRMSAESRRSQKISLWTLIVAFIASSMCAVTVDIYALTNRSTVCTKILGEEAGASNTVRYIFVRIFRYLVIIWAMIPIFRVPDSTPDGNNEEEDEHDTAYRPINDQYGSVSPAVASGDREALLRTPPLVAGNSFPRFTPKSLSPPSYGR